jgi:hypothetical protein
VLRPLGREKARYKVEPPAPATYNAAKKARKDGDREKAIGLLDKAIEADPTFTWALLLRARIHLEDGQEDECMDLLEALVALNYIEFAPMLGRVAWLKPLRSDEAAWGPFADRVEAYREEWVEALEGPGAFFVQGKYSKLEAVDDSGEPIDVRWARGVPFYWSQAQGRFLPLGPYTDVAGYLVDRESSRLVLVRWKPAGGEEAGLMGEVTLHRLDLAKLEEVGKGVVVAEEADVVRLSLDADGNVLVSIGEDGSEVLDGTEEDGEEVGEEEADDEEDGEEVDDEVDGEEADDVEDGEEGVTALTWESGALGPGTLAGEGEWSLVVTLGGTDGPLQESVGGEAADAPRAKRGGECFWIQEGASFCFEPTKKGGTWHNLVLVESGSEPRTITDEMIPMVQY